MSVGSALGTIIKERDALREALRPFAEMARLVDTLPRGGDLYVEMVAILGAHNVTPKALQTAKELVPPTPRWVLGWKDAVTGDIGTAVTAEAAVAKFVHDNPLRMVIRAS